MKKNGLTDPSQPESQTSDFGLESDNSIDSPETATSAPDPVTDAEADFVAPVVSSESPSDPEQPDPPKRPARKRTSSKRAVVHPVEQEPEVVLPPLETPPEDESEAQPEVPETEARPDVPEPETVLLPDAIEATASAAILDTTLADTENRVIPLERDWEPHVQDPDVEGIDAEEEISLLDDSDFGDSDTDPNPKLRRIHAPQSNLLDKAKSSVLSFVKTDLPNGLRRIGPVLATGASSSMLFIRSLFSKKARSIRRRKKKSRSTIRQTDRERVYKLRGYTTYEKVIAKRKAQRRFRIAQRITITLMCVGLLGYIAFRNNPFTDIDEMLRIIGIRKSVTIPFHQYAFPLILVESEGESGGEGDETGEPVTPPELTPENDFSKLIIQNGREDDRFYVLAYEGTGPLKADLDACLLTVAASDYAQLTTNRKVGTILVLLPKEGDNSSYRFTDVKQSGVIMDIAALPISAAGGENRVYMIGLLTDKPYHGYSYDVTAQTPTKSSVTP